TEWSVPDAAERRSLLETPVSNSGFSPLLDWLLDTETQIAGLLPLDQAFALWWWFPIFASGAAAFLLVRRFGGNRGLATAAAVLFVASPVNAWWSFLPSRVAWAPMAAVLILHSAGRRSGWRSVGLALLAGLLIARLPSSPYAPWSLVFALGAGALLLDLWHREGVRWRDCRAILVAPVAALGLLGLWWLDVGDRYRVLASTEYPGTRRDTGGTADLPSMWSGIFDGLHSIDNWSSNLIGSNLSEVAMGWTILLVPAGVLLVLASRGESGRPHRPPLAWSTGITVVLLLWSQIEWPSALSALNPLALVPGERVTQILGMWIAIPVVILMSSDRFNRKRSLPLIVGGIVVALGLWAANRHLTFFPDTSSVALIVIVILAAAASAALVDRHWQIPAVSVTAALSIVSVALVNPVVIGIGDLMDSDSAQTVRSLVGDGSGRVVSDDYTVDPMLRVNGASMVSGQQYWGPDEKSWLSLDPFGAGEAQWNRGTSYVTFAWDSTVAEAQIVAVQPDLVQIRIDPCATALAELDVSWIVTSRPLDGACLTEVASFQWRDMPRWILRRESS
ncbi:MAG: hypothetical protein O2870_09660, partial [Actinobacteria bacterium]|nr:hypothetical protein [Actinomycetota bacterium]